MMKGKLPKIIFAGDREIAVKVLKFIIEKGDVFPLALLVSSPREQSHAKELIELCSNLDTSLIFKGKQSKLPKNLKLIQNLNADYIIGVHFPYLIPKTLLNVPVGGVLNLHPAYLPYNRGWHTPSWAILDGSTYGATLHFVDEGLDSGDIIYQEKIKVLPNDTADSLYQKVMDLEFEVLKKAWPGLVSGKYQRRKQSLKSGTFHRKSDLVSIQEIDMDKRMKAGDLLKKLRALTTNKVEEAAYFKVNRTKYYAQVKITPEKGRK